ncbi:tetratricopeptide repeat protein [Olivibacter sp. SDN3]|uniref:tetratricopeptide repeat protein n=1 Tax=Olivibacter sp. SDN3 TaxID=2764720 RepID=UPI001651503F|nr:tetratricopeptide repeat protein [Olivibacter sp. SDN3]QNL48580.1 tetratricopeptide repeat protein [Olivibacter sp. SDN3]
MKIKSILLATLLLSSTAAFAQKGELNKAKNKYNSYATLTGGAVENLPELALKELGEAKEAIDKASEHDKTKDLPDTWTYLALINSEYAVINQKAEKQPEAEASYKTAGEAFTKAKSLSEGEDDEELQGNLERTGSLLANYEIGNGVKAFETNDFEAAYTAFNNGLTYMPGDSILTLYAGIAAQNSEKYDEAIDKFKELIPESSDAYLNLSDAYLRKGDTTAALQYIDEAAENFPDSAKIVNQKIVLNISTGKSENVISDIEAQMAADPSNADLPFYLGYAYESTKQPDKALEAYKKGIEAKDDDARNYGAAAAVILNQARDIYNEASGIPTNQEDEYNAKLKEAYDLADTAIPYLEKATELAPEERAGWENFRFYYQLKGEDEKAKEVTEKLNSL